MQRWGSGHHSYDLREQERRPLKWTRKTSSYQQCQGRRGWGLQGVHLLDHSSPQSQEVCTVHIILISTSRAIYSFACAVLFVLSFLFSLKIVTVCISRKKMGGVVSSRFILKEIERNRYLFKPRELFPARVFTVLMMFYLVFVWKHSVLTFLRLKLLSVDETLLYDHLNES